MSEDSEEEVVITIGKPPKKKKEEEKPPELEEEIDLEEELEEELEEAAEEEPGDEEPEEELEEAPEEGDVVVISLGEQPVEEEEELEEELVEEEEVEEVEEEEAVAAEVVEEKEEPVEEVEKKKRRKLAAILIVIVIIIASIGVFIFMQNPGPVAKLSLDPDTATTGEYITMDASGSTDDKEIVKYKWDFDDNTPTYTESSDLQGDGFDGITTHYYDDTGEYTVTLTVWDEENEKDQISKRITITDLVVTIPLGKIGDSCTYDVEGSIYIKNPDGLWSGTYEIYEFTIESIYIYYYGGMENAIEETTTAKDGYGEDHSTIERYTHQDLDLEATVDGTALYNGQEVQLPIPTQDGKLEITERAYTDLTSNKTIFQDTVLDFELAKGTDFGMESHDHLRSYSNLREKPATFSIEDLSPDRTFEIGDDQTKIIGDVSYLWYVKEATNINGYPALEIEIDIDPETKDKHSIQEFEMQVWISNQVPFPVQTKVYTLIDQDGNRTSIYYNSTIQENGYIEGNQPIPFGECDAFSPDDHYHFQNPSVQDKFVNWTNDDYLPEMGSGTDDFLFTAEEAIDNASIISSTFDSYLQNNQEVYVIDGYYNQTDETGDNDDPKWCLTFGEPDATTGYNIIVEKTDGSYSIIDEGEVDLPELINETSDFVKILSFSGSKEVFYNDYEVNPAVFSGSYVRFYEDTSEISYGARANMVYPSISLTVSLTPERAYYAYYVERKFENGDYFSAAVDAINGQLIYVWDHEGDDISAIIG
jgi:hypothetical protein